MRRNKSCVVRIGRVKGLLRDRVPVPAGPNGDTFAQTTSLTVAKPIYLRPCYTLGSASLYLSVLRLLNSASVSFSLSFPHSTLSHSMEFFFIFQHTQPVTLLYPSWWLSPTRNRVLHEYISLFCVPTKGLWKSRWEEKQAERKAV